MAQPMKQSPVAPATTPAAAPVSTPTSPAPTSPPSVETPPSAAPGSPGQPEAAAGAVGTPAPAPAAEAPATDAPPSLFQEGAAEKIFPPGEAAEGDYTLAMPEGMPKDDKLIEQFVPLAKELGLKKDAAQKLVDMYNSNILSRTKAAEEQAQKEEKERFGQWFQKIKNDQEIGGQKVQESVKAARAAATHFGGQELLDVLALSGLGNHPAVVKAFARIGKTMRADSVAGTATAAPATPKKPWELLYRAPNPK